MSETASLTGKTFCFTGVLEMPRAEARDVVKSRGGLVVNTVNSATDYLIVGNRPGSKLRRAQALGGVTILDEDAFEELIR